MNDEPHRIARRTFLGVAAAGALAACAPNPSGGAGGPAAPTDAGAASATAATNDATVGGTTPPTGTPRTSATASPRPATTTSTPAPAPTLGTGTPAGGPAAFVPNGSRTKPQVSLTYHANGDVGLATRLLDLLVQRGVHVTIFGVGSWMKANPTLVRRMLDDGHEVANHTWSHQTMGPLGRSVVADEIKRCADALAELTGSISPWFRPSGIEVPTALILEEAGKAGYRTSVGYDVDSLDFQDPGAKAVVANVSAKVKPGSIISVHFGHADTLDAMPGLLDLLAARQLAPVTVGTLLG